MLKQILNCLLGLSLVGASVSGNSSSLKLPDIGASSDRVITPAQERRLGEGLLRKLRQENKVINDPLVEDYLKSLGYKLVSNSDRPTQRFTFFVVNSGDINAFAAPGGFIGVNAGLILTTQSESELAAVMAHEIAHITQRHMARTYEAAGRYQWATAVAILAAILLGQQDSQLGEAALATGIASNAQLSLNFTRGNEREADAIGMQTLERSRFDPNAMADFFERMQKATRLYGTQLPEFLSTHPVTASRIAEARNRAAQLPPRKVHESENYFLVKARLRVLGATDSAQAENRFAQDLKNGSYRDENAERYGYALALLANGKYALARKQIHLLLRREPERIAFLITAAQIEMQSGNPDKALAMFHKALLIYPNNHPLTFYYAQALIHAGKPDKARGLLQSYLRDRKADAMMYKLYAQAAGDSGHLGEAYQNMAEYYFRNGQTGAAIDQLTAASKLKNLDFYQAAEIDARLRQFKTIARQEQQ